MSMTDDHHDEEVRRNGDVSSNALYFELCEVLKEGKMLNWTHCSVCLTTRDFFLRDVLKKNTPFTKGVLSAELRLRTRVIQKLKQVAGTMVIIIIIITLLGTCLKSTSHLH